MLTKILLTVFVAIGAWLVLRYRQQNRPPLYLPPTPAPPPPIELDKNPPMKIIALALTLFMMAGVGWFLYDEWFDGRRIVEVQVINANTGKVTLYDARKGEVNLQNGSFTTLGGNRVVLAAVERMEVRLKSPVSDP